MSDKYNSFKCPFPKCDKIFWCSKENYTKIPKVKIFEEESVDWMTTWKAFSTPALVLSVRLHCKDKHDFVFPAAVIPTRGTSLFPTEKVKPKEAFDEKMLDEKKNVIAALEAELKDHILKAKVIRAKLKDLKKIPQKNRSKKGCQSRKKSIGEETTSNRNKIFF